MEIKTLLTAAVVAASLQSASAADTDWKWTVGLNAAVARGNSSSTLVGGNILTTRKWEKNELSFSADGAYGKANGAKNVENYGGAAQYNRLVDERWFFLGHADIRRDTVANVNYRITLSPGAGYYLIKNDATTLSLEAGPGFVMEKFKGAPEQNYFTLRGAEKFTHKFNDHVSVTQFLEYQPKVDDFGNYVIDAGATLSAKIAGNLATTWTIRDSYRSEPAAGRLKNDVQFLAGLSYSF